MADTSPHEDGCELDFTKEPPTTDDEIEDFLVPEGEEDDAA